jgi:hypothetical protein
LKIYTNLCPFGGFPWQQQPTWGEIKAVAEAAVALRALRRDTMLKLNYSLRDLYRTLEQPGDDPLREAHARLDAAIRAAYGMARDVDPLAFLLELNFACGAKEKPVKKSRRRDCRCRARNRNGSSPTTASKYQLCKTNHATH